MRCEILWVLQHSYTEGIGPSVCMCSAMALFLGPNVAFVSPGRYRNVLRTLFAYRLQCQSGVVKYRKR